MPAALLDIDGTLVDSNYHHAAVWDDVLRANGLAVPRWRLHAAVGIGGDGYVRAVAGDEVERRLGDDLREAHGERFAELIGEVRALPGAETLIERLVEAGHAVVLCSSAGAGEADHYVDLLGVRDAVEWTTSADVDRTKPSPELLEVALGKAGAKTGVMVGDSVWDVIAAKRTGLPVIGLETGGVPACALQGAGADQTFEDVLQLADRLGETPFGG